MKVFQEKIALQKEIDLLKDDHQSIGFVPTMGALHFGHRSLIEQALKENDFVVCSIFVNPTQFNDSSDFEKYPNDIKKDVDFLGDLKDRLLIYNPKTSDIYPEDLTVSKVDFGILTSSLEGAFRENHFDGVVDVVRRLFQIVQPHTAYFGEKDFQQLAIIRHFVRKEEIPVTIIGCPIIREKDGLAMSSRNVRLSEIERIEAIEISKTLLRIKETNKKEKSINEILEECIAHLNNLPNTKVEYIKCVDDQTLQECETWNHSAYIRCCIAAFVGEVRLIDNMLVKP
jgi:pantoate--beta-alanine ligase